MVVVDRQEGRRRPPHDRPPARAAAKRRAPPPPPRFQLHLDRVTPRARFTRASSCRAPSSRGSCCHLRKVPSQDEARSSPSIEHNEQAAAARRTRRRSLLPQLVACGTCMAARAQAWIARDAATPRPAWLDSSKCVRWVDTRARLCTPAYKPTGHAAAMLGGCERQGAYTS
jgi:hypothetical protein